MAIERILLIDDSDANTLFFEMLLKDMGIKEVLKTTTGDDGIGIVKKSHVQFIIAAWEMKGMPGTVFVQRARAAKKKKYLPCVIYSKRMSDEDVKLTKELGFKDILSIPFDKAQAAAMIKGIIDRENNLPAPEILLRKIEGYLAEQKPSEALKLADKKMFDSPYTARGHTAMAEIWFRMSKIDKAEESLKEALKADDGYIPAIHLKGKILSRSGRHDEAIQLLSKLAEKSPKNLSTRVNLGSAFVQADRHQEAKAVFNSVLELDDDFREAKDNMAVLALKEGDLSLAEQLIAETENGDELASAFNSLAIFRVAKGEFDVGIETYKNAIRLLADKARLHLLFYNLGLAYRKKGDLAAGFQELARSYIHDPSFEKAYASLARVHQELKEKGLAYDKSLIKEVKEAREKFQAANKPTAA